MKVVHAEQFPCGCKYWRFDDGSHFIMGFDSKPLESSHEMKSAAWYQQIEAIAAYRPEGQ